MLLITDVIIRRRGVACQGKLGFFTDFWGLALFPMARFRREKPVGEENMSACPVLPFLFDRRFGGGLFGVHIFFFLQVSFQA